MKTAETLRSPVCKTGLCTFNSCKIGVPGAYRRITGIGNWRWLRKDWTCGWRVKDGKCVQHFGGGNLVGNVTFKYLIT